MADQEQHRTSQAPSRGAPSQTSEPEIAEDRYRYIGFEVFPKRIREFWKSDADRMAHLAHVREAGGRFVPLSRSNSMVASDPLSLSDRIVLTIGSILLLMAPLMPWFSFTRGDEKLVYSGYVLLFKAGAILEYFSLGPGLLTTAYMLLLALMVLSALFGAATLFALYTGRDADPEVYQRRVHRILNLHYLPIVGWVTFFSVAASPTVIPFAQSLGLGQVESTLNIASLATSSTVGLWVPFAVLWVNAIKGNDL